MSIRRILCNTNFLLCTLIMLQVNGEPLRTMWFGLAAVWIAASIFGKDES